MAMEFSIGGFNVKGWMVAVALPVLSTVSGGVYFGYDTLNRFYGVEGGVEESLGKQEVKPQLKPLLAQHPILLQPCLGQSCQ